MRVTIYVRCLPEKKDISSTSAQDSAVSSTANRRQKSTQAFHGKVMCKSSERWLESVMFALPFLRLASHHPCLAMMYEYAMALNRVSLLTTFFSPFPVLLFLFLFLLLF